jgi:hypothetical protein
MNVQDYNEPAAMTSREAANALLLIQSSRIWASTLQVARHFRGNESDPLLARFRYLNWKGERFLYLVLPESIELAMYNPYGADASPKPRWCLNADLVERDGDRRPGMGTRRRTFILKNITDLQLVNENGEPFKMERNS